MRFAILFTGLLTVLLPMTQGCASEVTIENYISPNIVTDLDYRDGVLAIGTPWGLHILKEGRLETFTVEDGLPSNYITNVALADANTLFVGPYPFSGSDPQKVYQVNMLESGIEVLEICGEHTLVSCYELFATGPDGSLWVGDSLGLCRFKDGAWFDYHREGMYNFILGAISFGQDGRVYVQDWMSWVYDVSSQNMQLVSTPVSAFAIAVDADNALWLCGRYSLWKQEGDGWDCVIDQLDSEWYMTRDMFFDGAGRLWAINTASLGMHQNGETRTFTEGAGLTFDKSLYGDYFTCHSALPSGNALFGTWGPGLILFDGGDFSRLYVQDAIPSDQILDILQDVEGRMWVTNSSSRTIGVFDSGHWHNIEAPWYIFSYGFPMAQDLDGSIWIRSQTGAALWNGSSFEFFNSENSELDGTGAVAVDSRGTKWFANSRSDERAAASLDGETWTQYSSTDYFSSQYPDTVVVGPSDKIWFRRKVENNPIGYTTCSGESWEQLEPGRDLPEAGFGVFFDIDGNALLAGREALYRQDPFSKAWQPLTQKRFEDVQADSDGRLFCAATDGLHIYDGIGWQTVTQDDGLCPGYDYDGADAPPRRSNICRVVIDHNGDKWVGAADSLSRMQDGGAAAQKLTLRVDEGETTVALTGEFINTYTTMPVSLWLACSYNGTLYFYPDWTPTMGCTDMVLEAHLFEERELCSFDKASLPLGTLTFIGGLSLRGGSDLMIGPRDNKLSFATWGKE